MMRIGNGFDVHAFGDGDHVTLGGVRVPHSHGVVAHSDGDVVIHALCDAIFGALALGDIGTHFPPSDERWRNADSRQFLRHAALLMEQHGYALGNADITVICERPKVGPHAQAMRECLAADLDSDPRPHQRQGHHHRKARLHRSWRRHRGTGCCAT
jgi:2-C-methyl-D-erythritol 2,4-cyclodiphosphate synthase